MSAILAALEAMEVDERAWTRTGLVRCMVDSDGVRIGEVWPWTGDSHVWWHYCSPTHERLLPDAGIVDSEIDAKLIVQRARFAHAIAACNRAASRVTPPGPTARGG